MVEARVNKGHPVCHMQLSEWGDGLTVTSVSMSQAIEHAIATSGQANKRALARKHLIEKRKEEQERLLLEQEREQEEQRMIQLRISEEAEEKRRKADMYDQACKCSMHLHLGSAA